MILIEGEWMFLILMYYVFEMFKVYQDVFFLDIEIMFVDYEWKGEMLL